MPGKLIRIPTESHTRVYKFSRTNPTAETQQDIADRAAGRRTRIGAGKDRRHGMNGRWSGEDFRW